MPCTPPDEGKKYANSVDKALYLSYEAYLEAARNSITAMRCRLVHLLVKAIHGDRAL